MVEAYLNGSSDVTFYDLDIYNSPIIKCRRIISNYVGMAPGFLIHVHTSSLFCSIEEQCYLWYHFIIEHDICIFLYDFKHVVQNHNWNVSINIIYTPRKCFKLWSHIKDIPKVANLDSFFPFPPITMVVTIFWYQRCIINQRRFLLRRIISSLCS